MALRIFRRAGMAQLREKLLQLIRVSAGHERGRVLFDCSLTADALNARPRKRLNYRAP
ncbi:hypothetical protein IMW82_05310 [Rhodanobacter sp. B2A1Ga4]|uniref:hypothetical protein n=1 Tax=Rhodanobacter TaxID=75309 RepID=UPI001901A2A0|nr:hypothetical protein [Rhodanobacter thiooxydans]MBQ4854086.1 hypothetical protein [Rhodanobacter sp. B2A1Ga4]